MDVISSYVAAVVAVVGFHYVASAPSKLPVCSSYGGLCDVTFDVTMHNSLSGTNKFTSSQNLCICPGKYTCPISVNDTARVYYQEMTSSDMTIMTRLSYCDHKEFPSRICRKYETAVKLRGSGPILLDLVDLRCRCLEPLILHKSYPDDNSNPDGWFYSVREYTCGQQTCNINRSNPPVCERTTSKFPFGSSSEILCQCPDGFMCDTNNKGMVGALGDPVEYHCDIA